MDKLKLTPKSKKEAIVQGDKWRFTVLTENLIRLEYSEEGIFEDRATQTVINRDFDVPKFTVKDTEEKIVISTSRFILTYYKKPFSKNTLNIHRIDTSETWYYGNPTGTLPGTVRTLDATNGEVPLEPSIMSVFQVGIIDDSKTSILNEDNTVVPRVNSNIDMYVFTYGTDYYGCLKDFYKLTGPTPLVPRFALGNWWSRYHKYTQEEYMGLINRFKEEGYPFSVAIIDMDWHIVDIPKKYGSGWTGFTWNKELFPDHVGFLKFLADNHLKNALNVHPASGIRAYEQCYKAIGEAMGVDVENEEPVAFDIADPKFIDAYFKYVNHPLEDEGVDFWWLDWQQGDATKIPGLDPLWMLNHYHYLDNSRGNKRALTFSRYAGPGSHRYPIGFSGDTAINWNCLDFQPFFTSTASNIGYSWWSHDIGGHMNGWQDEELHVRWIQYGIFSPIFRLHSSSNPFLMKEPWTKSIGAQHILRKYMRLRHQLIPYIYTMNERTHKDCKPLVAPLFYEVPINNANRNEFFFGTEMLVMPITKKLDDVTHTAVFPNAYLPEGDWFDLFTNKRYKGGKFYTLYRGIDDIPVMVKAGGIIPLAILTDEINDTSNPEGFEVKIFPGADNSFSLYEDNDVQEPVFEKGDILYTDFNLKYGKDVNFTISTRGNLAISPKRKYVLSFENVENYDSIKVMQGGKELEFKAEITETATLIYIENFEADKEISVEIKAVKLRKIDLEKEIFDVLAKSSAANFLKEDAYNRIIGETDFAMAFAKIMTTGLPFELKDAIHEVTSAEI